MRSKLKVRKRLAERLISPLAEFAQQEASSGIVLILCAIVAVVCVNSAIGDSYMAFWQMPISLGAGDSHLSMPLITWINDGLMAVFFLLVGLEIKRELLIGELSSVRRATLPVVAAIGGMLVPAITFAVFNHGTPDVRGWGIPMATDIAFALGVLALLGDRIPFPLKVFLAAIAIVDDIGAVLVIAVFYTDHLNLQALGVAGIFFAVLLVVNRLEARSPIVYAVLGLGLWMGILGSGIHATIAGVLLAATIPTRVHLNSKEFVEEGLGAIDLVQKSGEGGPKVLLNEVRQGAIHSLEKACELAQMPLERISNAIERWVAFLIVPLFALANAGVVLTALHTIWSDPIGLGVLLGLVLGKPVGIALFSFAAVKFGAADLPKGVTWRQVIGVGVLAGIGFTMSLFITELAFTSNASIDKAKVSILSASLVAGTAGFLLLLTGSKAAPGEPGSKSPAKA